MISGELRKYFTVDGDAVLTEAVDKLVVRKRMLTDGGVDMDLPESALVRFFLATIVVGVLAGFKNGFFGQLEDAFAATAKTFGALDPLLVAGAAGWAVGSSGHRGYL